ncbi:MAG: MmgE/PrpD family protein, partial [Methanobrevibacter sp.]|nr:MmgE/PrpD family protein [Methanobrevibacter sp.]
MIINQLSEYLIDLKYEDIPEEAIEKAKLCFIDYLAVYLRGLESENAKIAIKTIYELHNGDFNSLNKGFINGIASHSLDLDDGHRLAQLHPGSVVFSTVLAMVSDKNLGLDISGEEFFEAVVIGYEIAIVLGMMLNPNHRNQGFHSSGTIGSIAAGAVASKLLNLDLEKIAHCLGLATTQSSGLLEADHAGTMGKSLHIGNAVYNGIISAFLAKNGFTGGESLIDGKEGFIKAMASEVYD